MYGIGQDSIASIDGESTPMTDVMTKGKVAEVSQRFPNVPVAPAAGGAAPPTAAPTAAPLAPPPVDVADRTPAAATPPLAIILDDLSASVEGVNGALLASVDGFAIARSLSRIQISEPTRPY